MKLKIKKLKKKFRQKIRFYVFLNIGETMGAL